MPVSGSGFVVHEPQTGTTAVLNRDYVWTLLPPAMEPWQFTEIQGGESARVGACVAPDSYVYVAFASTTPGLAVGVSGWERQPELNLKLKLSDGTETD